MPSYSAEFDRLLMDKERELQRALFPQETAAVAIGLVEAWFEQGRTDDLIRYFLKEFPQEGELEEISMLARLLSKQQQIEKITELFESLTKRRVKAYREWLAKAPTGHIGNMRSASHALAHAMDIQTEYCIWLEKLGQTQTYEEVRARMLELLDGLLRAASAQKRAGKNRT